MKNLIEQIARQNGVKAGEVRKDISEMIRIGMNSADPEAIRFWSQFGMGVPSPEEFLYALTVYVRMKTERK